MGEVVVPRPGNRASPPALADLGKERVDGAERPSTLSLPARLRRDGGVKPLQATPTYRYRISDSHGRGRSTSPMGIRAAALPHSQTWARKGSMEQSVHRPFRCRSLRRDGEVNPSKPPPTYRYRISDSHGRGRSTSPMGIRSPPALADLGKERVDGAERPSTLSCPLAFRRDGGVKPLQATPTYRYRISDSHGRGRSTSPMKSIRSPPALADLGKERVDGAERPSTLSLPAQLRRDGG